MTNNDPTLNPQATDGAEPTEGMLGRKTSRRGFLLGAASALALAACSARGGDIATPAPKQGGETTSPSAHPSSSEATPSAQVTATEQKKGGEKLLFNDPELDWTNPSRKPAPDKFTPENLEYFVGQDGKSMTLEQFQTWATPTVEQCPTALDAHKMFISRMDALRSMITNPNIPKPEKMWELYPTEHSNWGGAVTYSLLWAQANVLFDTLTGKPWAEQPTAITNKEHSLMGWLAYAAGRTVSGPDYKGGFISSNEKVYSSLTNGNAVITSVMTLKDNGGQIPTLKTDENTALALRVGWIKDPTGKRWVLDTLASENK